MGKSTVELMQSPSNFKFLNFLIHYSCVNQAYNFPINFFTFNTGQLFALLKKHLSAENQSVVP